MSNVKDLMAQGARVIDVRTIEEYNAGHVEGSLNIPLDTIEGQIGSIKEAGTPVITVCRSGARSGAAAAILSQHGVQVVNGGPWNEVASMLQ